MADTALRINPDVTWTVVIESGRDLRCAVRCAKWG
jgi:hypothetical protein